MKSSKHIFHHRWFLPICAEMQKQGGGTKFVTILRRLQLSRSVLSKMFLVLEREHFVKRNLGHGHPMRPEYILTKKGSRIGILGIELLNLSMDQEHHRLFQSKWAFPTLLVLAKGESRFNEIVYNLGSTTRALSLELKALEKFGLIERKIVDSFPPRPIYLLTKAGKEYVEVFSKHDFNELDQLLI